MRYLLVDLSGMFRRHWAVSEDEPVNRARRQTVDEVRRLASEANADRVAICCDSRGPTWRHELLPRVETIDEKGNVKATGYKAHREQASPLLYEEMRAAVDDLAAEGYAVLSADGFEADDVIGTLVGWLLGRDTECRDQVTIVSGDKDFCQLVVPGVSVFDPINNRTFDEGAVLAHFGVPPEQIPDLLALAGDSSDGIPGVPSVGKKTAPALLAVCGSARAVVDAALREPAHFVTRGRGFTKGVCGRLIESAPHIDTWLALARLATVPDLDCARILAPQIPQPIARRATTAPPATPENDDMIIDHDENGEVHDTPAAPISGPHVTLAQPGEGDGATTPERTPPPAARAQRTEFALALEPATLEQAMWLGDEAVNSRLFAKSVGSNSSAALSIIMTGRDFGLTAMQSLRGIHIVEGRPELSAQLMMALCLRHPACEYFEVIECTRKVCTVETKRRGNRKETSVTMTIEEAQEAGLTMSGGDKPKANWARHPDDMLFARCVAKLARRVYPDAVHNTYVDGEIAA